MTKQYLYQLAYKKFIKAHNIAVVKNCFLMPTEKNEIIDKGTAKMEMLEALGLENIQIRLMPATMMYEYYLTQRKIDVAGKVLRINRKEFLLRRKKQINGKKKLSTSSLSENLRFKSVQH